MISALHGKRIVNTRTLHQASELDRLLDQRGAIPLSYPCIAIKPLEDPAPLDQSLHELMQGRFNWLVFTSGNTVQAVSDRLHALGLDQTLPAGVAVAAIGPSTARAVMEAFGRAAEIMPERHDGESLGFVMPVAAGDTVLAPGSDIARSELTQILEEKGAIVTPVVAYQTVAGSGGVDLPAMLRNRRVDGITFASSSAVEGFFKRLLNDRANEASLIGIPIVCIGETTSETVERFGLSSHAPPSQTLKGMVDTLERLFVPVGSGGTV